MFFVITISIIYVIRSNREDKMKCFIVLPCYNEENNVKPLVSAVDLALRQHILYQIIAVNDGSTDHTGEALRRLSQKYPLRLLEHRTNKGLAAALKTGLNEAIRCSSFDDLIVTMDSDNTHEPRQIRDLMSAAREADIVVGSRYVTNGKQFGVPLYRMMASKATNFIFRRILRLPINDVTSGYRCFKASVLKRLNEISKHDFIESDGFEVSLEILAKVFWCNATLKEVPITLDYYKKKGKSKMKMLPTVKRYLILLTKIKAWSNRFKKHTRSFQASQEE